MSPRGDGNRPSTGALSYLQRALIALGTTVVLSAVVAASVSTQPWPDPPPPADAALRAGTTHGASASGPQPPQDGASPTGPSPAPSAADRTTPSPGAASPAPVPAVSTTTPTCTTTALTPTAPVTGYVLAGCDDFNNASSTHFFPYSGVNSSVVGVGRTPSQCAFEDGQLIEYQAADGATCGGATDFSSVYGLWEVRLRTFSTGNGVGSQPWPVMLLWPDDDDWTEGEIDFFETNVGASASGYVHCVGSNPADNCLYLPPQAIDIATYHVYSILWQSDRLTGYIDGQQWWTTTDPAAIPTSPMHLTVQLDNISESLPVDPGQMDVDWVHFYTPAQGR